MAAFQHFVMPQPFVAPPVFTDEELRGITVPTTVLIGEHEVIYRDGGQAALQRAQALILGVRAVLIPGASHVQTLDNPAAVGAAMLEGLA